MYDYANNHSAARTLDAQHRAWTGRGWLEDAASRSVTYHPSLWDRLGDRLLRLLGNVRY